MYAAYSKRVDSKIAWEIRLLLARIRCGGGAKGIIFLTVDSPSTRWTGHSALCETYRRRACQVCPRSFSGTWPEWRPDRGGDESNWNGRILFDGDNHVRCGGRLIKIFVLGRNAYKNLGMHPAEMVLIHFGELLETYAGDAEPNIQGIIQSIREEIVYFRE